MVTRKFSLKEKEGMTLIEVLLSIVILSIVIVTFLTMFVQSARTNKYSEKMLNATYTAQTEMEKIYNKSTQNVAIKAGMNSLGFSGDESLFEKESNGFYVTAEVVPVGNIKKVIVKVYRNRSDKKLEAQMETRMEWQVK